MHLNRDRHAKSSQFKNILNGHVPVNSWFNQIFFFFLRGSTFFIDFDSVHFPFIEIISRGSKVKRNQLPMNFSQSTSNPSQVRLGQRASMRFNVLVVGEGKIGKSTFLGALLDKYSTARLVIDDCSNSQCKLTGVRNVGNLELTSECQVHLFESVGYGDSINNEESIPRIKCFLKSAHKKWNEMSWNRVTEQVAR